MRTVIIMRTATTMTMTVAAAAEGKAVLQHVEHLRALAEEEDLSKRCSRVGRGTHVTGRGSPLERRTRSPRGFILRSSRSSSSSLAEAATMCSPSSNGSGSAPGNKYGWLQHLISPHSRVVSADLVLAESAGGCSTCATRRAR